MNQAPTSTTPTTPKPRTKRLTKAQKVAATAQAEQTVQAEQQVPVITERIEYVTETTRLSARPRRVDPEVLSAVVTQSAPSAEANQSFTELAPGDQCPSAPEVFWRTVGRALDRQLPTELLKPLVLAFEGVMLSTCSGVEATRRFMPLADETVELRSLGHRAPSRAGVRYNQLQAALVLEYLAGRDGWFLLGAVERIANTCRSMHWQLREVVVMHLLALWHHELNSHVGENIERSKLIEPVSAHAERLCNERRRLFKAMGETRAAGLDVDLVNHWLETDRPDTVGRWVDDMIAKKSGKTMATALASHHVRAEVV